LKNLPENINKRRSLSSNEEEFNTTIQPYQEALSNSGYDYKLKYNPTPEFNNNNKNRNILLWYNPPFSSTVKTKIGKKFLQIIDKCFLPNNQLNKIFNRKTIKISYSCMPNMKNIIDGSNQYKLKTAHISTTTTKLNAAQCNCKQPSHYPLNGKCLYKDVIYQATVTRHDNNSSQSYIGLCSTTFKTRFNNHKASFLHADKANNTQLNRHIWNLKGNNTKSSLK